MRKTSFPLVVEAVVIDLDGTLLDTVPDLASAINRMLVELDQAPLMEQRIANFVGKGVAHLVRCTLTETYGQEPDAAFFERALSLFMDCYERVNGERTRPYPGVIEGLDALRAKGLPLACVTNKIARFTLPLLRHQKLEHYFREIISGDTLPERKPHPLPLTHTAAQFGIAPCELLMVGDSLNDVVAARAAGCSIFCVDYGYNEGHDVREFDVDAIVPSLLEASKLITKS